MKQKTAMMELVDYMKANFHLTDESLEKFDELIEKEKEQIVNAFDAMGYPSDFTDAEQYYNENYKQD